MQIIIHIGYHKTATTWFQKILYPNISNYHYISDRKELHKVIFEPDVFEFDEKNARSFYNQKYSGNIILCEEMLVGGLRGNGYETLIVANRLKHAFPENAYIVIFLRNQLDRLASTYLYYLKANGGTYSPKKFLIKRHNFPGRKGDVNYRHLEYHRLIELYKDRFGEDKVKVFLYEEFAQHQKQFINRYCTEMGLELDDSKLNFKKMNEGLRERVIPIARFLGNFYYRPIIHKTVLLKLPYAEGISRRIINTLNKWPIMGERPTAYDLFGEKLHNELSDFYRESNRILIEKYGLDSIREYGYPL